MQQAPLSAPQAPQAITVNRALDWAVKVAVFMIAGIVIPWAGYQFSREVARVDALELRVAELERRDAVREVRMDGFRADLERVPTLEQIRVVIREEIDRARLGPPQ